MARGGLRKNNKSGFNHLFKPKWNNKKTTAIRIPEIFKDTLLFIAKYLDILQNSDAVQKIIVEDIQNLSLYKKELEKSKIEIKKLQKNLKNIPKQADKKTNQNKLNDYQIAVKCFDEFIESQSLSIEDLSKSRKGTKKYQLYEIHSWLSEQAKKAN